MNKDIMRKLPVWLGKFLFASALLLIPFLITGVTFISISTYHYFHENAEISIKIENAPDRMYYIDMLALTHRGENGGATTNSKMYYENNEMQEQLAGYNMEMVDILRNYRIDGDDDPDPYFRSRFGGAHDSDPLINVSNEGHTYKFTETVPKLFYIILVTDDMQTIVSPKIALRCPKGKFTFDVQTGKLKRSYPTDIILMPLMFIAAVFSMCFARGIFFGSIPELKHITAVSIPFLILPFIAYDITTYLYMTEYFMVKNAPFILPVFFLAIILESIGEALLLCIIKKDRGIRSFLEESILSYGYNAFGWTIFSFAFVIIMFAGSFFMRMI